MKYLIDTPQQFTGISRAVLALNPQICLEICHQERSRHAFARNISGYQNETGFPKFEEIEVIASDLTSLNTHTSQFKRLDGRQILREKPCLNLFGNVEFICAAPFRLEFLSDQVPLYFDFAGHLIEPCECE